MKVKSYLKVKGEVRRAVSQQQFSTKMHFEKWNIMMGDEKKAVCAFQSANRRYGGMIRRMGRADELPHITGAGAFQLPNSLFQREPKERLYIRLSTAAILPEGVSKGTVSLWPPEAYSTLRPFQTEFVPGRVAGGECAATHRRAFPDLHGTGISRLPRRG